MYLDQETLRLVFGIKLRGLRLDRGLSLKELAGKTGLSASYLNEIEKGKKYPKSEKILLIAQALNEKYEDLVSLQLKKDLALVKELIDNQLLEKMPFDLFGIPLNTLFELLAEKPKKMRALIGTCLEIARAHNIQVEDFLYATLRAYLDMHQNYFPAIEEKVLHARKQWPPFQQALSEYTQSGYTLNGADSNNEDAKKTDQLHEIYKLLVNKLLSVQNLQVLERPFNENIQRIPYYLNKKQTPPTLYINSYLKLNEKIFVVARLLGYSFMNLKSEPLSSSLSRLESFDQLFDHFSASYFASSLLIPEDSAVKDIQSIFADAPSSSAGNAWLTKYPVNPESLFHRFTQLLPKHFGIDQLFFLRYEYNSSKKGFEVSRELHLSSLHSPHSIKGKEHYCARWITHTLTQQILKESKPQIAGIQRSVFENSGQDYLVFASAYQKSQNPTDIATVSLGLLVTPQLQKQVSWLNSSAINKRTVNDTCERCSISDCQERLAPFDLSLDPKLKERLHKEFESLL